MREYVIDTFANMTDLADSLISMKNMAEQIQLDFPNHTIEFNDMIAFPKEYCDLIRNGTKAASVKYKPGFIRIPEFKNLPVYRVDGEKIDTSNIIGHVACTTIIVKRYDELDKADAKKDGFRNLDELKNMLKKSYESYGLIPDDGLLSIWCFGAFLPIK